MDGGNTIPVTRVSNGGEIGLCTPCTEATPSAEGVASVSGVWRRPPMGGVAGLCEWCVGSTTTLRLNLIVLAAGSSFIEIFVIYVEFGCLSIKCILVAVFNPHMILQMMSRQ